MSDLSVDRGVIDGHPADEAARPQYSIITVTYGNRPVTERFLTSLADCYGPRLGTDVELVLVDNASPDDTPELLSHWSDRATVILSDVNLNYAGANNAGARAARGDVLVLLNNDTELLEPLDRLVDQVREPGVGIAGCRLLYPDGTIQHGGCAWAADPAGRILPFHLFRFESGDLAAAATIVDGDAVTGACLAIRRELFLELGGLDELYVNGLEDMDLCVRARLAGQRVVYRGDIELIHAEGASRSRRPNDALNQRLFLSRYESILQADGPRFASQLDAGQPNVANGVFAVWSHPSDSPGGASVSVEGEVVGLATESAEARSLLQLLDAAGLMPSTREWQPVALIPGYSPNDAHVLEQGRLRPRRRNALIVQAPVGDLGAVEIHPRAILRLAHHPSRDISPVAAVWAAHPALADALVAEGLDPEKVAVLAPCLPEMPLGRGGEGWLVGLPAHDLARCREILGALAQEDGARRVRLLPTMATESVAALAARLAPDAELLAPISREDRFVALAAGCDVVLAADPRDGFERRALGAAATGTCVIHLPGGTAAWVLGDALAFDGSPACLAAAREATSPGDRAARAARVNRACGPATVVPQLRHLIARAAERAGAQEPAARLRRALVQVG